MIPRLQEQFGSKILPELKDSFEIKNPMCLPKIKKVSVNMGVGKHISESKVIEQCAAELTLITGQKAVKTKAKVSEAGFKIRQGQNVGIRVTLRRQRMWEFLDRFMNIAAPRIRDFRGFSRRGFDAKGNYSFGITEQNIFPEVNLDKMEATQGMNITIVFENSEPQKSEKALELLGFPFERKN